MNPFFLIFSLQHINSTLSHFFIIYYNYYLILMDQYVYVYVCASLFLNFVGVIVICLKARFLFMCLLCLWKGQREYCNPIVFFFLSLEVSMLNAGSTYLMLLLSFFSLVECCILILVFPLRTIFPRCLIILVQMW